MRGSSAPDRDQREARLRVDALMERSRRLHEDNLECRPDVRLEQMPAVRRSICFPDDDVCVHLRLLPLVYRDVAREREHLYLLVDRDPRVVPALAIEVTDDEIAEGADPREVRRRQV